MVRRILEIGNLSGEPRVIHDPPRPMTVQRAVKILQRRKMFLQDRMAVYRAKRASSESSTLVHSDAGNRDKAEWAALRFALNVLDPDCAIRSSNTAWVPDTDGDDADTAPTEE